MREKLVAVLFLFILVFGNINLNDRIVFEWADGTKSTVLSKSFAFDQEIVLLPTIVNGRPVTDREAVSYYLRTGEHLGIFSTEVEAKDYADRLHKQQEDMIR